MLSGFYLIPCLRGSLPSNQIIKWLRDSLQSNEEKCYKIDNTGLKQKMCTAASQ